MKSHDFKGIAIFSVVLGCCLGVILLYSCDWENSLPQQAKSGDLSLPVLSKEEVIKLLDDSHPATRWPENPFVAPPSYEKPYYQGKLSDEAIQAAVDRLNAIRRLSGIPPVVSDPDWNDWCQYGAVVAGLNGSIKHGGYTLPADDPEFLRKGNESTGLSNMVAGGNAAEKMDSFQDDSGNWEQLGHRMVQFVPTLAAIGIGAASPGATLGYCYQDYAGVGGKKGYTQDPFDWNFVSFPSPGYFPVRAGFWRWQTPGYWHIELNSSKYANPSKEKVTVTLTRKSDKKTWVFSNSSLVDNYVASGNKLLFYHSDGYNDNDQVQVHVQGLQSKDGHPIEDIIFTVHFFDYTPPSK